MGSSCRRTISPCLPRRPRRRPPGRSPRRSRTLSGRSATLRAGRPSADQGVASGCSLQRTGQQAVLPAVRPRQKIPRHRRVRLLRQMRLGLPAQQYSHGERQTGLERRLHPLHGLHLPLSEGGHRIRQAQRGPAPLRLRRRGLIQLRRWKRYGQTRSKRIGPQGRRRHGACPVLYHLSSSRIFKIG